MDIFPVKLNFKALITMCLNNNEPTVIVIKWSLYGEYVRNVKVPSNSSTFGL